MALEKSLSRVKPVFKRGKLKIYSVERMRLLLRTPNPAHLETAMPKPMLKPLVKPLQSTPLTSRIIPLGLTARPVRKVVSVASAVLMGLALTACQEAASVEQSAPTSSDLIPGNQTIAEALSRGILRMGPDRTPYVSGRLLLTWHARDAAERAAIRERYGLSTLQDFARLGVEVVRTPESQTLQLLSLLAREPAVRSVELDGVFHPDLQPDDLSSLQWNLQNSGQNRGLQDADVDAPEAWEQGRDCSSVVVGVVDTGISMNHPDLRDEVWTNPLEIPGNGMDDDLNGYVDDVHGWNFVAQNNNANDDVNHGSHVSGIIGAAGNNSTVTMSELGEKGMVGVCWAARIMPAKALGRFWGSTSNVVAAFDYTIFNGARIINASLSGSRNSDALLTTLSAAADADILVVVSAGNDGVNIDVTPTYPASYELPNMITVGATTRTDALADFSNYGPLSVDVMAPGVDIYSTMVKNPYGLMNGTSMAAPHVAGAAAILWARYNVLTAEEVRESLLDSADAKSNLSGVCATGGRLNLFTSILKADEVMGVPSPYIP